MTKNNVWYKMPEKRVELIHPVTLEYKDEEGNWHYHDASKTEPIHGVVDAQKYKQIGSRRITFYRFKPDFYTGDDGLWEFSSSWFRNEKSQPKQE